MEEGMDPPELLYRHCVELRRNLIAELHIQHDCVSLPPPSSPPFDESPKVFTSLSLVGTKGRMKSLKAILFK